MTTRPTTIPTLLLLTATLLAPRPGEAKPCRTACRTEVASCQAACDDVGRGAQRRRCRKACRRALATACRSHEGPGCLVPGTTWTLPPFVTTTTTSTTTLSTPTTLPGAAAPTGFLPGVRVTSDGVDRTYAIFVPPTYDPSHAYPLVFAFHGDGGSGAGLRAALGLEALAGGAAIFVYPDATDESGRHWTLDANLAANADMHFFVDTIGHVAATYNVDPTRVFATGHSSGGYFANFLNCTLGSAHLRAIAPHSGSGPYGGDGDYDVNGFFLCPADPAAALLIHGVADDVVPLDDGAYSRRQWVFENGCAETTGPSASPAPCVAHHSCDDGKPVEWCAIPGLGHGLWAQAPQAIWGFFARFLDAPPAQAGSTMRVAGRDLFDPAGEKVVLRGVNKMNVFDPNDRHGAVAFPDIRATGANTVRIVWMTQTEFFVPTAADLDAVLGNAIANELIPMIELHDATGSLGLVGALVDYWTRPDVLAVLRKHERFLLLNVANEAGDWDTTAGEFAGAYQDAVARLRAAGLRCPLVIDAPDYGKNIDVVMETADDLIAADPEHNLLFSVHTYWPIAWGMGGGYVWTKLGGAALAGVPLVVGEFSRYGAWTAPDAGICGPAGEVDYQAVLQAAQYYGIGWYAWEWGPGNGFGDPACAVMDMTADGRGATLKPGWATDVVSGPWGIGATSVVPRSIRP